MKKFYMLGMVLTMVAGFAFAGSLSVPWFVDMPNAATKLPPVTLSTTCLVYLHNNLETDIVCDIAYYSATGGFLGPDLDENTFSIPALSTVAFRPNVYDPSTVSGGQESAVAVLVPDRPTVSPDGLYTDTRPNGSIVIGWSTGGAQDVQGMILTTQNVDGGATGRLVQWGTLLPPGVS